MVLYAVTIMVPGTKKVGTKFYDKLTAGQQKFFIEDELKNWSFTEKYYEKTPSCTFKRLHLHGCIELEDPVQEWGGSSPLIEFTGNVLMSFMTPKCNLKNILLIEPVYDMAGWHRYCTKQQQRVLSVDLDYDSDGVEIVELPFIFNKK